MTDLQNQGCLSYRATKSSSSYSLEFLNPQTDRWDPATDVTVTWDADSSGAVTLLQITNTTTSTLGFRINRLESSLNDMSFAISNSSTLPIGLSCSHGVTLTPQRLSPATSFTLAAGTAHPTITNDSGATLTVDGNTVTSSATITNRAALSSYNGSQSVTLGPIPETRAAAIHPYNGTSPNDCQWVGLKTASAIHTVTIWLDSTSVSNIYLNLSASLPPTGESVIRGFAVVDELGSVKVPDPTFTVAHSSSREQVG